MNEYSQFQLSVVEIAYDYTGAYAAVTGVGAVELIISGLIKRAETKEERRYSEMKAKMKMKEEKMEDMQDE